MPKAVPTRETTARRIRAESDGRIGPCAATPGAHMVITTQTRPKEVSTAMLRKLLFILVALAGAGFVAFRLVVRPWWRGWGVVPDEAGKPLAGDDLIPDAGVSETRGIGIAAAPAAIWPWLLQMGYGRAGWYSYDAIDMAGPSSDRLDPDLAHLRVGDVVPTHPGGGFLVKIVEPERALVMYSDNELMEQQAAAARVAGAPEPSANVRATGAFMENAQPGEFAASWAFVLEPMPDGGTRLIERVRTRFGESDKPWTRYTLPVMGFGVFVMVRRQLLGIKERVERIGQATPAHANA
jgi:hypothetical protein